MTTTEQIREAVEKSLLSLEDAGASAQAHYIVNYFSSLARHQPAIWDEFIRESRGGIPA